MNSLIPYPLWLKIWLGGFGGIVLIGCFPYIVMYFKVRGKPMWKLPIWRENRVARFLIATPEGGYSPETWAARPYLSRDSSSKSAPLLSLLPSDEFSS